MRVPLRLSLSLNQSLSLPLRLCQSFSISFICNGQGGRQSLKELLLLCEDKKKRHPMHRGGDAEMKRAAS